MIGLADQAEDAALLTRDVCARMDAADPLAPVRDRFVLPAGEIYLDGNSLGAMPKSVADRMARAVSAEWAHGLIRSWNDADWYLAPQRAGAAIAGLIGARAEQVIVCDSTSVNLFKVMVAAARLRPGRSVIVAERGSFPTDVYIAGSVAELMGLELRCVEPDAVEQTMEAAGDALAFVQLTHVNYKTGRIYDMPGITARAQAQGALAIWDLAHSAGALPLHLDRDGVDLAVGCGYKYLNGGPGAPSFVYVAERHLAALDQPLRGWHGHATPFAFTHEYEAQPGIAKMLTGTAPQLSLIALEAALAAFDGVDIAAVRAKNAALGDLFIRLADQELAGHGFGLGCPRDSAARGSQVSLTHPEGYAIMQALIARGVVGDFRAPDILRFGLVALYVGYADVWDAVSHLRQIMQSAEWDSPRFRTRKAVT